MTATRKQMAQAFACFAGKVPRHPTVTLVHEANGVTAYELHGNRIASFDDNATPRVIRFDWCGWYTPTTAAHMNEILRAAGAGVRVSYAQARDNGATTFEVQA